MRMPPDGVALLQIAIDTLKQEVLPDLPAEKVYDVRMALNAMGIAQRQLKTGSQAEAVEISRMVAAGYEADSLEKMNAQLASSVRNGEADQRDDLKKLLWEQTLMKVRESAPGYLKQEHLK